MRDIISLDVTLRDGGNRINFAFSENDLAFILEPLDRSGVEYIEIGYRNGAIRPLPGLGPAGLCAKSYVLTCAAFIQHAKMAVMGHPENISAADLLELKRCGVSLFRVCVSRHNVEAACAVIAAGKELELQMSANIIHISQYSEALLQKTLDKLARSSPDMLYFADSNGSLLPKKVMIMYKKYGEQLGLPLGFHAHDNLGLAQANVLAAIDAGVNYIDFSLAGFGKGGGNLKAEFFGAYLHAQKIYKYNLQALLEAANYVRKTFKTESETLEMAEFVRGISDLSTAQIKARIDEDIGINA
jgi:4-hydroxy 2-oxovalerate aldolase